jgi:hypothetical protein
MKGSTEVTEFGAVHASLLNVDATAARSFLGIDTNEKKECFLADCQELGDESLRSLYTRLDEIFKKP